MRTYFLKIFIFPIAELVMKTRVIYYYHKIKRMESWNKTKIENWQNKNLRKLVNYTYVNSAYYKELFDKLRIRPEDIKTKSDLGKIPILTRELIIENFDKLVSKKIDTIPHKKQETGGTTGTPMPYLLDNRSWSFSNADYIVNWERTNYNFGDKHVALGGSSIFKRTSLKHKIFYHLKNKIGLDGMNLSDDLLGEYVEFINRNKIKYIYGYASSIYLLAKYVSTNNISTNIIACFPTSEILIDLYRKTILEAFNCKIVNCYGAHDGGITAFDHCEGNFEVSYNAIVRIKDMKEGDKLKGPILVTNLLNYAMPMINYQLGDEVKLKENTDNYNGQVIEEVYGRIPDIIRLENGRILTGFSFYERLFQLPVEAFNLEKKGKNTLLCKIIKQDGFKESHEAIIFLKLKEFAGADTIVEIEYYDKFELTPSGKRNYYISS